MNLRREKFVREYLRTGNATKAAQRAGYSSRTAYSQGERLLKNAEVQQALDAIRKRANEKGLVDLIEAKRILSRIVRAKLSGLMAANGSPDIAKIKRTGQELMEFVVDEIPFGTRIKIKLRDPIAAIERLAKLSGWDAPEKHSIEGSILVIE